MGNRYATKPNKKSSLSSYLGITAIIGIAASSGNMINIGLSYGIHWSRLESIAFMETFAIDFPLLLYPTGLTILPAFLATLFIYSKEQKGSDAKKYWLYALIGLVVINIQTVVYHLPLNIKFIEGTLDTHEISTTLKNWIAMHWIRVTASIVCAIYAIKGYSRVKSKTDDC